MAVALGSDPSNIRLRWLSREVAFANGRPAEAAIAVTAAPEKPTRASSSPVRAHHTRS